jgi:hypothetical protein
VSSLASVVLQQICWPIWHHSDTHVAWILRRHGSNRAHERVLLIHQNLHGRPSSWLLGTEISLLDEGYEAIYVSRKNGMVPLEVAGKIFNETTCLDNML